VVDWATQGGARALGLDSVIGSLEPGKKADIVLIKNDASPVMFPLLNPYGHAAFQAQRGDVHTVIVNGRVLKHEHRLTGTDLRQARQALRRPSSTCRARSGRTRGRKACTRRFRRPR
jgi:5-methylthioadenosine/S-adenosylhomocysteine deaminase